MLIGGFRYSPDRLILFVGMGCGGGTSGDLSMGDASILAGTFQVTLVAPDASSGRRAIPRWLARSTTEPRRPACSGRCPRRWATVGCSSLVPFCNTPLRQQRGLCRRQHLPSLSQGGVGRQRAGQRLFPLVTSICNRSRVPISRWLVPRCPSRRFSGAPSLRSQPAAAPMPR